MIVDNCFATPILQRPLQWGADLVVHSATKWLDRQSRVLGGVVVGKKQLIEPIYLFARTTGPALAPFNAWILSRSLEILEIRMQRHSESAHYLADHLMQVATITNIRYPFLINHPHYEVAKKQMLAVGGLLCFELVGGLQKGQQFINNLQRLSLTANLGDTRSIVSHPASTKHAKFKEKELLTVGITRGLIRISVGLVHRNDIMADILQALDKCM